MPTREVLRFSHLGVARNNVFGKTSPPCNPFFLGEADGVDFGVSSTDPRVVLFSEELSAARGNPCPECVPCAELSLEEQSCCGKGRFMVSVWGWLMQPGTWHASVHEEVRVNVGNANASTGRLGTRGDVYFVSELMHIGSVGCDCFWILDLERFCSLATATRQTHLLTRLCYARSPGY